MKRIVIALFLLGSIVSVSCAETAQDAQDAKEMDRLHDKIVRTKKQVDRLMKDILTTYSDQTDAVIGTFGPDIKVDIIDAGKNMIVKADLPGMEKDKIEITLEKNKFLKISGSREIVKSQTAPGMVRQERSIGKFDRVIELPFEGAAQGIMASYKDGVLEIVIPKKEPSKEDTVKIKVL
jgi:HSP20 family protein